MDSQRLRDFRQQASGVSRALWPANMRRSLPTGRVAQQRRSLLISGKWGALLANTLHAATSLLVILISMCVGSTIVVALLLRLWYLLLIPAAMLALMTILVTPLFLLKLYRTFHPAALHPSRRLRGLPLFTGTRRAPETPLPTTPLVRVLETYDLSQGAVEHTCAASPGDEYAPAEFFLD